MRLDPNATSLPKRSELTDTPGQPPGARWLWGEDDELGRLNLLTPERTAAAASLIKAGQVVNLNLRADLPDPPVFGRERFKHTIKPLGGPGNDDLYELNTQSGSQWDGYRHVATKHEGKWTFYNGTRLIASSITQHDIETTSKMGMEPWAKHGIVGRGVLLDIWSFLNKSYDPFTSHAITFEQIKACAEAQKVQFRYGDILILRTGWVDAYLRKGQDERNKLGEVVGLNHEFVGVEQSQEMIDFLHDNYFSAVAGDQPGFEKWPPPKDPVLHSILLPLWGLPIGEMWDLEELSEVCRERGQYTFFFASTPANVPGGVGSISNAMAVF